jgi:hypothetical protein
MPSQRRFDEPRIEQRRESVVDGETHGRSAGGNESEWLHPLPRRPVTGSERPQRGHVLVSLACLGEHLATHEQRDLDANAGEPDSFSLDLRAGSDVVITSQFAPAHARAVVGEADRALARVGGDRDECRSRVQ